MAAQASSNAQSAQTTRASDSDWAELLPMSVGAENAMGPRQVQEVWGKMMQKAGLKQPAEKTQRAFRLAVYAYCCKNGASREGNYSGSFTLNDGTDCQAACIPYAAGKMNIRKFLRGNMLESYTALKTSRVIERDEVMVARADELGISAGCAFAMADWLADCPQFTPEEARAHAASFNYSIRRAAGARKGLTLEDVEAGRVEENVETQSYTNAASERRMGGKPVF